MTLKDYITLIEEEDEALALVGIQRAAEHDADLTPADRQTVLAAVSAAAKKLR